MQFFRVREKSMTLAEVLTGARKTYGINLIGGVRRDMLKHQREQCIKLIGEMREELKTLTDILLNTPNMEQRTVGVGVLAKDIARDFSPVGPMIRGSGFARDVRKVHPFSGYGDIPFNLFTEANGDVLSRVKVRINEVFESMNIIDYMVDNLPSGEILKEGFNYTPGRFALGITRHHVAKIFTGQC